MKRLALCLALILAGMRSAPGLNIQLDFSDDTTNFFAQTPLAKQALLKAASDLDAAILPTLGAVNTDTFMGTNGTATASIDWKLTYTNPTSGATVTLDTFQFPADTVTIYVGMQKLTGSTLGEGGPGAAGVNLGQSYSNANDWPGALANAQAASNTVMMRGHGPVMGSLSGSFPAGAVNANYNLSYGEMIGNIWFDDDTNNDGTIDSAATMAAFWHYDPTTAVEPGKNDLYSVALHEMLHAIGFGTSETWDDLANGTNWSGTEADTLQGGGTGLITTDGHIASGVMGHRISDGGLQNPVMVPALTTGTRDSLTDLDLAFLRDIGYATVPEPSGTALAMVGLGITMGRRWRRDRRAGKLALSVST